MSKRKKATFKVICSESKGKINFSIEYTSNIDRDEFVKMDLDQRDVYFQSEGFSLENKELKMLEIASVLEKALNENFNEDLDNKPTIKTRIFGA
ncbi:hypothetical protein [Myroides odoratimimus]|uniref:hypothetical protein n=1 Tax=Myroides odoratimimus TaxID=76832 RepID=UPI00257648F0|nr:hypothetical protein [Myroides odoratimimus]MDM1060895.1 hypothetical protein [Myroides odoratimimus]MDM1086831.1 hypothetical protein [Myroides odoratimimus]MDM1098311.1 hypothetical protein [Myroides odoratimimus]